MFTVITGLSDLNSNGSDQQKFAYTMSVQTRGVLYCKYMQSY